MLLASSASKRIEATAKRNICTKLYENRSKTEISRAYAKRVLGPRIGAHFMAPGLDLTMMVI